MPEKFPKKDDVAEIAHEKMDELEHEVLKELPKEEKKLELTEESKNDLEEDLVRLQAEFDNYRKRVAKELSESRDFGKMEFAKSILEFVDEFETAAEHFEGEHKKGVEMMFANLLKILENSGVREMKCVGEKYDPYKHEAILQQESEKASGTIIAVARKGYFFKDSVLRHAQVIVAKKKEEKKGEEAKKE